MSRQIYFSTYQPSRHAPRQTAIKQKQPRRRKLFIYGAFIMVVVLGIYFGFAKVAEAHERHKIADQQLLAKEKAQNISALNGQIQNILSDNAGINFSISIIDNDNGKAIHFGHNSAFDSGSVGKLITATDFLRQVELGRENLNETIHGSSARYELQQMIVQSDDDAWAALNNELGYKQLQSYANEIGLANYNATADTLPSDDIAMLLQKFYAGKLLDNTDTQLLLGYLKQANYRTFMVPAVPASDTIYHKVGLVDDDVHDAAIITNDSDSLELVIFSNGNGIYNWQNRAKIMQQITKDVLNAYFVSLP